VNKHSTQMKLCLVVQELAMYVITAIINRKKLALDAQQAKETKRKLQIYNKTFAIK